MVWVGVRLVGCGGAPGVVFVGFGNFEGSHNVVPCFEDPDSGTDAKTPALSGAVQMPTQGSGSGFSAGLLTVRYPLLKPSVRVGVERRGSAHGFTPLRTAVLGLRRAQREVRRSSTASR
jgi:hypothetical protein